VNWLRLYVETLDDPKVQSLDGETFKRWIGALCIARKHEGILPAVETIAFYLRLPAPEVEITLNRLEAVHLLDRTEAGLVPHNWGSRQYVSDDPTAYVRRFRAKRKDSQSSEKRRQNTDTDTETDTDAKHFVKQPRNISPSNGQLALAFDQFWAQYPRKTGKGAARKAFGKASEKTTVDMILSGLQAQLPQLQNREMRFIVHPSRWLNEDRWSDAVEPEALPIPNSTSRRYPKGSHEMHYQVGRLFTHSVAIDALPDMRDHSHCLPLPNKVERLLLRPACPICNPHLQSR